MTVFNLKRSSGSLTTILVLASLFISPSLSIAHPVDGFPVEDKPSFYDGSNSGSAIPEDWNMGDLTFIPMESYPAWEELSNGEKYVFVAATNTSLGHPMPSWSDIVFLTASAYYNKFGSLPPVLDHDAWQAATEIDPISGVHPSLECLLSPITGSYPRLDAASFSPGDLFMRVLTVSEMEHFADLYEAAGSSHVRDLWFGSECEMQSPVFYVRIYGENGVIANRIMYSYQCH